ncbi:MAG: galactose mutarotase [Muribaculaceae bacterium]|nr:galactose mutarotase [Muribaculaceae bacterium]
MKITESKVTSPEGDIRIFRIENEAGAYVLLSSYGAGVLEVGVPDREGKIENVALRYADPIDYIGDGPNMGKTPGRYANRICEGRINIAGTDYQLATNLPPHHLHGGEKGFSNRNWEPQTEGDSTVIFRYKSADGEENYPGTLEAEVRYEWNDRNELSITFKAVTDRETVVNLTNHTYWNLRGADSGTALDHEIRMKAHGWLPTGKTQIPTGEIASVEGTPMDFTEWKAVGKDIDQDFEALRIGKGYDHCWAIDGWRPGEIIENAVELRDSRSGRILRMSSDQPGMQLYSGNWLAGSPKNCSGCSYEDYEGVAIEMQGFPDAPNQPGFPSQTLLPGDIYLRRIRIGFDTF